MTKAEIEKIVKSSVEDVWYNMRFTDPVKRQTEEITSRLWIGLKEQVQANEQNNRMRIWFEGQTGLKDALLSEHMEYLTNKLNTNGRS